MICRNCGGEIPEGKMFCPYCGTEVQLVPDYSTIDMMAEQKLLEEEDPEEENTAVRRRRHPAVTVLLAVLILIGSGAAVFGLIRLIDYHNLGRFGYQKTQALQLMEAGKYKEALSASERALALSPQSADMKRLSADALNSLGRNEEAAGLLTGLIEEGHADADTYEALIKIRISEGDADAVAALVKESEDETLYARYGEYLAEIPEFSLDKNTVYDPGTRLKITAAGYGKIYYTLDGSQPTENSTLYSGSIPLEPGASHVRAIFINEKGVVSETADAFFTVRSETESTSSI